MFGRLLRCRLHGSSLSYLYIHYTILWLQVKGVADGSERFALIHYVMRNMSSGMMGERPESAVAIRHPLDFFLNLFLSSL
jgi:hypothetical protein